MLAYITWDPAPGFYVGHHLVRWYSLLFGIMVLYNCALSYWFFVREKAPFSDYWPAMTAIVVGGVVGARLAHVFFYDWPYFSQHLSDIPKIWKGGLASHGGAVGIALAIYLYARFKGKVYYWWYYDRLAVGLPLGAFLIRLGNLFNVELYGKPTQVPWAFVYPAVDMLPRHPVEVYEMLYSLAIAVIMFWVYLRKGQQLHFGFLTGLFLVLINVARIATEFFKDSPVTALGLNTAQLLSIAFLLAGILLIYLSRKRYLD